MKKILLVQNDPDLFALLKYSLDREGYALAGSRTGKEAVRLCRREKPDLIILDMMLPDSGGLEVWRSLRAYPELRRIPVVFLAATASEAERIAGLKPGANDCVVKPVVVRELLERIRGRLRDRPPGARVLRVGPLELNRANCQVRRAGKPIALTATEFKLLEILLSRPGAVFSREQFLDAVWGPGRAVTARTVDVCILRLRRKVESGPGALALIRSVRGLGYSFAYAPEQAAD